MGVGRVSPRDPVLVNCGWFHRLKLFNKDPKGGETPSGRIVKTKKWVHNLVL